MEGVFDYRNARRAAAAAVADTIDNTPQYAIDAIAMKFVCTQAGTSTSAPRAQELPYKIWNFMSSRRAIAPDEKKKDGSNSD